jgi:hypothetical protein
MPGEISRVFDRDGIRRIVLTVHEAGQPEDPITVRTGRIAAEGNRKQLESTFLVFDSEAFNSPEHLVFAKRCRKDRSGRRNRIGGAEGGESGFAFGIQIEVQMPHASDAFFGAPVGPKAKRIGYHIDIGAGRILVRKPVQVTGRKSSLQGDDSLKRRTGNFTP